MNHGQTVKCNNCGDIKPLRTHNAAYYNASCEECHTGEYTQVI